MFKMTEQRLCKDLLMLRENGIRLMTYLGPKYIISKAVLIIFTIILFLQNDPIFRAASIVVAGYLTGMILANIRSVIILKNAWPLFKEFINWKKVEETGQGGSE